MFLFLNFSKRTPRFDLIRMYRDSDQSDNCKVVDLTPYTEQEADQMSLLQTGIVHPQASGSDPFVLAGSSWQDVLHHTERVVGGVCHGFDVGMRHSVELMEVQLHVVTDVDVCALVLCCVAVLWCREDYN